MGSEARGAAHAMSVDVEEWTNATILQETGRITPPGDVVVRNVDALLEMFAGTGTRATWFFLGEIAERFPFLVARVAEAGHELGVHGFHHHSTAVLGPAGLREALRRAKAAVERAGGRAATGYRAVDFGVNERTLWVLDEVLDAGFAYDSSIFPLRRPRYGLRGSPAEPHWRRAPSGRWIFEVPVSVLRLGRAGLPFAGGGYFRLLPLLATSSAAWLVARRRPLVFYLHPCEIERTSGLGRLPEALTAVEQQRVRSAFARESRGRSGTRAKYEALLSRRTFRSIAEVVGLPGLVAPDEPSGLQEGTWPTART
jgi:polysaccharide deacetylase family protein (PEP-CTERM system associated)